MAVGNKLITIVGCGPGSPDYITPAARTAAERADVLAGARRLLDLFSSSAQLIEMKSSVNAFLDEVEKQHATGRSVCILVTGDPGLCSLAKPVLRRFGRDCCRVVPGVSSLQAAFAAIGIDWLDAKILNAHGKSPDIDKASLAEASKIAILLGDKESVAWAADFVQTVRQDARVFLCSDLTLENEIVEEVPPSGFTALIAPSRSILIVIDRTLLS